jgi:hypothetical protein
MFKDKENKNKKHFMMNEKHFFSYEKQTAWVLKQFLSF